MTKSGLPSGPIALLLPLAMTTVVAVIVALAMTMLLSVQTHDDQALITRLSPDAYLTNVFAPLFPRVLLRSALISAAVTAASLLLAYPVAYFLAFRARRFKALLLILVTAPSFSSYLLKVFGWKMILGYGGVINATLMSLGVIDRPLGFLLYNPTAIVIVLTHAYVAFAVLPIYVALDRIDTTLLEASADLGAQPLSTFLEVTLPLSMSGVIAAALLIFLPTLGDYVTPTLVGGPDGVMIGNLIQAQFGKANDWPAGSAIATATMTLAGAFLAFAWLGFRRWGRVDA
jgi:spermidine/putrescine transport system permease protein